MNDPNPQSDGSGPGRPGRIHILMCTHNGAAHLADQLQSFLDQTCKDWDLWVRDDASTDATLDILTDFRAAHPDRDIHVLRGDGQGSAVNFITLMAHPDLPPGPMALADQDDIWLPHKLERAMAELARIGGGADGLEWPAVYSSRTYLTDARMQGRRPSVIHRRGPSFDNALVQNILAGNAMVLNAPAAALLRQAAPAALAARVSHHDWWIYLVATAAGARVVNDPEPGLLYRQHDRNLMGANRGLGRAMERLRMLKDGRYAAWVDSNLAALQNAPTSIAPARQARLAAFAGVRQNRSALGRIWGLYRLGLRRQTWTGTAALYVLAFIGRL